MPEPADRLQQLLTSNDVGLDRIMAVVASVAPDPPTEGDVVAEIDELAVALGARPIASKTLSAGDVVSYTYAELAFVGNTGNYYSPSNSFIHRVLRSRRGIPLTLAAVASEIGRRVNVQLSVVGLPGHVILGDGPSPSRWFDPFAIGGELDLEDCRRLFARFHPIGAFDPAMVEPIDPVAFTTRMLTNLKLVYRRLGDLSQLAKVLELSVVLPSSSTAERHELAAILAALGREDQAAEQRDLLIGLDPDKADAHRLAARRHRARRN